MQDRIPVNPGRVLVTPENGNTPYYATLTRADNPTQEGTPLNKTSLLKDATAAKFGLGTDAVPDDVSFLLSRFHAGLGNEYVWAKYAVETDVETLVGYVNSPDSSAYPIDDGYTYTALGQLGNKVQIATGSYTGTGTYGASNPTSLTFDFAPSVVCIGFYRTTQAVNLQPTTNSSNIETFPSVFYGHTLTREYRYFGSNSRFCIKKSEGGKTFTWYATSDASDQMNNTGYEYYYIAIG